MTSSVNLYFKIFAGFPTTIAYGGTSFVTTELAPTTAPLEILTPQDYRITSYPYIIFNEGLVEWIIEFPIK